MICELCKRGFMTCSNCQTQKPKSDFHKNSAMSTGFNNWCKICKAKDNKRQIERRSVKNMREIKPEPETKLIIKEIRTGAGVLLSDRCAR